jgi:hypothetical protein
MLMKSWLLARIARIPLSSQSASSALDEGEKVGIDHVGSVIQVMLQPYSNAIKDPRVFEARI